MKTLIAGLIFLVLLSGFGLAQDCQYTIEVNNQLIEKAFFYQNGSYYGKAPIFDNFTNGVGRTVPTYTIHNQINRDIKINLSHFIIDTSAIYGQEYFRNIVVDISQYSELIVSWNPPAGNGYTYFDQNRISYTLLEPTDLILKTDYVPAVICKICPSGHQCLDDGQKCPSSSDCGSGICNIAGICGINGSQFLDGGCPEGLKNCNNESCKEPSVKGVGQSYSCDWECKTGVGSDGICSEKWLDTIMKIVYAILVTLVLIVIGYYIFIKTRKLDRKQQEEIANKIEELNLLNKKLKKLGNTKIKRFEEAKENIIRAKNELLESYQKDYPNHKLIFSGPYIRFEKDVKDTSKPGEFLHIYVFRNQRNNGKKLPEGAQVHHINRNKLDNRIENLRLVTKDEHDKLHGKSK